MKRLLLILLFSVCTVLPVYGAVSDFAGIYSGTYSGIENGKWMAAVESNGHVSLLTYSSTSDEMDGSRGYYVDSSGNYTGLVDEAVINAVFYSTGTMSGTWTVTGYGGGSISGTRQTANSQYRGTYSGTFSGLDTGTWNMTIDETGEITGTTYSSTYGSNIIEGFVDNAGMMMAVIDDTGLYGSISGSSVRGSWYAEFEEYGGTFSGSRQLAYPNLTPYKPSGWSDKIVVSRQTGTFIDDDPIYAGENLYIDWAVDNDGSVNVTSYTTALYVDNIWTSSWTDSLNVGYYGYVEDYSIGSLTAGIHTVKIVTDSEGQVTESNEADNEYVKTITVAAAPSYSYTYYLPVFKPQPGYWSGLGITNLSKTSNANVSLTVYSQSGSALTTQTKLVNANGQTSFVLGAGLSSDGWIKILSDQELAGLNFLGQYEGLTSNYYLADVPFTQALSTSMVIPHVSQNATWDTSIYIANPNTSATGTTLTYVNKSGTASTPYIVSIPANGSRGISVADIGGSTSIKGGYVTISSSLGLTAFALYNNLKTGNYSYAGISAVDNSATTATYDYFLPVFKPQPEFWSGFGITNLNGTSSAGVDLTVYNQNGAPLANQAVTIAAGGQASGLVGSSLNDDGWIKVSSNQPLAGLNFLGQYEGGGNDYYLGDVPFTQTLSKLLVIPHVAQNATWDTSIYVANPNTTTSVVTLVYTDKSGIPLAPYVTTIPANGSKAVSVSTITGSTSIKGGHVTISSLKPLTAFALYNNLKTGNYSYAGINGVDISQ